MKFKFKIMAVRVALIAAVCLSGCNTARGFGEDLEKGGQIIQKAAEPQSNNGAKNNAVSSRNKQTQAAAH